MWQLNSVWSCNEEWISNVGLVNAFGFALTTSLIVLLLTLLVGMVRFKHRYLLCELIWDNGFCNPTVDSNVFKQSVKHSILSSFGTYGAGLCAAGLNIKYFNNVTNLCIARAPRAHFEMVWTALTVLRAVQDMRCTIRVIHTGGSIRSCQSAAIEHSRKMLKVLLSKPELLSIHDIDTASLLQQEEQLKAITD
ncbi:hypothetical protein P9112_011878 [Eukaryota sp. TZLM1-RC]